MNADKFFKKHSIEEISKKTKISPITLKLIKNKEFEKIPKAKFNGFIKIIEKEFNVSLDELKEEFNNFHKNIDTEQTEIPENPLKESSNNIYYIIFGITLLIIGGYFLLQHSPKKELKKSPVSNETIIQPDNNKSQNYNEINTSAEKNKISIENKNINESIEKPKEENNITNEKNETTIIKTKPIQKPKPKLKVKTLNNEINISKALLDNKLIVIPHQRVWYKVLNIDTNRTYETLTSRIKVFKGGNYYMKFGHGNITILYKDLNITPNNKKILRILIKDGNYTLMKKPNRYEK